MHISAQLDYKSTQLPLEHSVCWHEYADKRTALQAFLLRYNTSYIIYPMILDIIAVTEITQYYSIMHRYILYNMKVTFHTDLNKYIFSYEVHQFFIFFIQSYQYQLQWRTVYRKLNDLFCITIVTGQHCLHCLSLLDYLIDQFYITLRISLYLKYLKEMNILFRSCN